jgi:hypothetical protein
MKVVARYVWGKTKRGYGWKPWEGTGLSIEREGQSGFWGVCESDGTWLCVCTSYRGAQRVVARLRKAELARFNPRSGLDFALLVESPQGVAYEGYSEWPEYLCDHGKVFSSREAAAAFVHQRERTVVQ